jgi:hypothetical protein
MPRLIKAFALVLGFLLLGGCCRDTIRELASVKDVAHRPQKQQSARVDRDRDRSTKSARVERDDDDDDRGKIETGSVDKPDCQGQHLAYQATKEYLKNFGPKPPDEPGEKGPCR